MSEVIDIFTRLRLENGLNGEFDSYECQFIEYDPEMPVALELFVGLDQTVLLEGCWVYA
jgi:hypothetical protein